MNTTRGHTWIDNKYRYLEMLLWQADLDERNGSKQHAFEIRAWVANFLSLNRRRNNEI